MTRDEGVHLASRSLALLMIIWALVDVTYLPDVVTSLVHYLRQRTILVPQNYWIHHYEMITTFYVFRTVALFIAARWFWRCGPGVQAAFSWSQNDSLSNG
jgi:hypothetical protein